MEMQDIIIEKNFSIEYEVVTNTNNQTEVIMCYHLIAAKTENDIFAIYGESYSSYEEFRNTFDKLVFENKYTDYKTLAAFVKKVKAIFQLI